ncbi:MAG: hypothetical protein ACJ79K_15850 [Gemmatimonadaceae bacterium]
MTRRATFAVLAALSTALPATLLAQGAPPPATAAAQSFFAALHDGRWPAAAAAVDSSSMSAIREMELSMMIAWAQHRAEFARAMRGKGSGALSGGYSVSDHIDARLLEKYGATAAPGFPGAPTVAAIAALPPRVFLTDILALSDSEEIYGPPPSHERNRFDRTIVGEVVENDSIAHVLYRVSAPHYVATDPLQVSVLRLHRRDDRWLVDLTMLD